MHGAVVKSEGEVDDDERPFDVPGRETRVLRIWEGKVAVEEGQGGGGMIIGGRACRGLRLSRLKIGEGEGGRK